MDPRDRLGRAIAQAATPQRKGNGPYWTVQSQSHKATYLVDEDERSCTCLDYETHQEPCKHIFAVDHARKRDVSFVDKVDDKPERPTYSQNWTAYNAAQIYEKEHVASLLRELCSAITNPPQKRGRPRIPLSDGVFCAVMKVYGATSGRRAMTDIRAYEAQGLIDKAPCYNTIFKVLESPDVTYILRRIIEESAAPLKTVEVNFAVDSSGFSTSHYDRWYSAKYGRQMSKNTWLKAHVMVGVKTNVIASAEVTDGLANDAPLLADLVERVAAKFDILEVSADKAYSSRTSLFAIENAGGTPYIPFRVNARAHGPDLWGRMYHYFMFNREEFLRHYHRRSNVETTFAMVKAKFGTKVRSKNATAQVNEILCKLVAHNLCCLVHAAYELGIDPKFWQKGAAA